MSELLILVIDLVPLFLEPLSDLCHFFFAEAVFVDLMFFVEVSDHFILVIDIFLDLV